MKYAANPGLPNPPKGGSFTFSLTFRSSCGLTRNTTGSTPRAKLLVPVRAVLAVAAAPVADENVVASHVEARVQMHVLGAIRAVVPPQRRVSVVVRAHVASLPFSATNAASNSISASP